MKQYHELVQHILSHGIRKENRTGVDTVSTFNYNYEHDLADGFPLLTTKKMSWKNIVIELLWFLSGSNKADFLQRHGCNFWAPWTDDHQVVSNCYGPAWVRFPATRVLEPVSTPEVSGDDYVRPSFADVPVEATHELCGQTFVSVTFGAFVVKRLVGRDESGRGLFDVQFTETGYVARSIRADVVQRGEVRDPYTRVFAGVGYPGEPGPIPSGKLRKDLRKVWQHMIERCYNRNCKEYRYYGERGVQVCARWHNFACFLADCACLPGWSNKRDEPKKYAIDKDYFASNVYSPTTCVWLSHDDNRRYARSQPVRVTFPTGESVVVEDTTKAAELLGVERMSAYEALWGKRACNGAMLERVEENLRYPLPNDQIRWLVDELLVNPLSRRMVVSAWAPGIAQTAKLPPCHCMFIVNVQNEAVGFSRYKQRLCLHLTQRSCDAFLGVPYNLASYALLMHLLSRFSGIEPGTFGHSLVDLHLYTSKPDGSMAEYDHVPVALEQLRRAPRKLSTLRIADSIQYLEDVERLLDPAVTTEEIMSLFVLDGYDPWPALSAKVAV